MVMIAAAGVLGYDSYSRIARLSPQQALWFVCTCRAACALGPQIRYPDSSIWICYVNSPLSFFSNQVPGGLRMGAPALTSRGFVESDFEQVADFVDRCAPTQQGVKLW